MRINLMAKITNYNAVLILLFFISSLVEINCAFDESPEKNENKLFDVQQLVREAAKGIEIVHTLERERELLRQDGVQDQVKSLNVPNLMHDLINGLGNASHNRCHRDFFYMEESIRNTDYKDVENSWALKMLDSYGKPESGILEGNFRWLGDFDECKSVYAPKNGSDGGFNGKYCSLGVIAFNVLPLTIGICLPETCEPSDFGNSSNFENELAIPNVNVTSLTCKKNKLELSNGAIATLLIISLFLLMVLLGSFITAYKYFTNSATSDKPCENQADEENTPVNGNISNGISLDTLVSNEESPSRFKALVDKCDPFLNCFCIFTNGSKLLNTDATEGQLLCLHGIRFLSMSWVILCHAYQAPSSLVRTKKNIIPLVDNLPFQVVLNGFYSVDSFFVLSGFLMAYLYFQECAKRKGKTPWLYFYVHRYLRLTPIYMIVMAFYATVIPVMGSGPFWMDSNVDETCRTDWWKNLIYINNFEDVQCMPWAWYLANDMQFFVISPILLISLWRWPKVGYIILAYFLCGSWLCGFLITYQHNLLAGTLSYITPTLMTDPQFSLRTTEYFNKIYTKPYTRIGPYLIGIALGHILFKRKITNSKISQTTLWIGWLLAVPTGLYCIYGLYHQVPSLLAASFYNGFIRTVYGLSLSWLIFVCVSGKGGVVDKILSYKLLIPLSRLTYSAYLIHPLFLTLWDFSMRTTFVFSQSAIVQSFLGTLTMTYAFAILVSLTFESPLIRVEKLVRKRLQTK